MLDKLDAEFAFGRAALDLRANRQMLLSSNIANANTPGYRARDVDFASTLAVKLKRATSPPLMSSLSTAAPGHMNIVASAHAHDTLLYRVPVQPALDGNTVDLDLERVQFANNTLHYEAGLTVLTQHIKSMLAAITSGG